VDGGIELGDDVVSLYRGIPNGFERYDLPMPAAATVKEGINLPRYPAMRERLRAKKAEVRMFDAQKRPGGLEKIRLHLPPQVDTETVILGTGADAALRVADVLEELGLL
jgi:electron transfer flavoprotein beta subunit